MTHVDEHGNVWLAEEPPGKCDLCGAVEETRPYGPNGENVCYPCGEKDPEAVDRAIGRMLEGRRLAGIVVLPGPSAEQA